MPMLSTPGFDPKALTRRTVGPVVSMPSLPHGSCPVRWGGEDFNGGCLPIIGSYDVPSAGQLQLTYVDLCRRAPRYESGVFRAGLLDGLDGDGLVSVEGVLADWRHDGRGSVTRIMLSAPVVRLSRDRTLPVGNHVWLNRSTMLPGIPDHPGVMHLGEVMGATGRVVGYDDRHGRHRLGLADWRAYCCGLLYVHLDADGHGWLKHVPRHTITLLAVFSFDAAGVCHWRDGRELACELKDLARSVEPLPLARLANGSDWLK